MSKMQMETTVDPETGYVKLGKKTLKRCMLRYICSRQVCFNYETMQSGGWVWSMMPAMEEIYPDQDDLLAEKYSEYFKFFNTHPWFGLLIFVATLAIEGTKDEDATTTAVDVRTGLMGPLAGLGDSVVWVILPTVMGSIAAYMAMEGSMLGTVLACVVCAALWMVFWFASYPVYDLGISFVTSKSGQLKNLTDAVSILGIIVIGAMTVTTVSAAFGISWTVGDLTQDLDSLLNQIIPNFANVLCMIAVYFALDIKGMTASKLVWIIMIVAIVLGALGILA